MRERLSYHSYHIIRKVCDNSESKDLQNLLGGIFDFELVDDFNSFQLVSFTHFAS